MEQYFVSLVKVVAHPHANFASFRSSIQEIQDDSRGTMMGSKSSRVPVV